MKELSNNLIELLKELSKAKIKFVVCGGVACVLHGVERATYDIDLSVSFEKSNLEKIVEVVKSFDLKPSIPEPVEYLFDEKKREEWFIEKGALVYFCFRQFPFAARYFFKLSCFIRKTVKEFR